MRAVGVDTNAQTAVPQQWYLAAEQGVATNQV